MLFLKDHPSSLVASNSYVDYPGSVKSTALDALDGDIPNKYKRFLGYAADLSKGMPISPERMNNISKLLLNTRVPQQVKNLVGGDNMVEWLKHIKYQQWGKETK